jgi:hypothetical protein
VKTKTANLTICKKFDEWLETITDEAVRKKVNEGSILTGGAIASMLLREPINDFDFYFKDLDTARSVAEYYVNVFNQNPPQKTSNANPVTIKVECSDDRVRIVIKSAGVAGAQNATYEYFEGRPPEASEEYATKVIEAKESQEEKPDYRPVFLSDNALTLSGGVQLVIRFFGSPDEVHANYDFVHATNYWTSWDRKVTLRTEALECLLTKELRYTGSKYPICSLIRARKFIQREWTINAGQYLKIAFQINELELTDFNVLREQLIGMDVAYFMQVLALLKEKDPAKVNTAYLVEIIDRIFG